MDNPIDPTLIHDAATKVQDHAGGLLDSISGETVGDIVETVFDGAAEVVGEIASAIFDAF